MTRITRRTLLPAAILLAAGCTPTPQAYRIAGASSGTPTYQILFLGAGFQSDSELEAYRAAANTLASAMVTSDTFPYRDYAANLSFWRVDVRSTAPIGTSTCATSTASATTGAPCSHSTIVAPPPKSAPPPLETVNPSGDAVVEEDLHVSLCYTESATPGPCNLVWATDDGQRTAEELAASVGDVDAVVILANTQVSAGATRQGKLSGGQALVVVGVPIDALTGEADGFNLLAHELAHTLGLADEYTTASGLPATSASDYANVWQPEDPCYEPDTSTPDTPTGAAKTIPWSTLLACDSAMALDPTFDCDYTTADSGCPRVWYPLHSGCGGLAPRSSIDDSCKVVGLFEGAFYASEGIYRAEWACKMNNLSDPFCDVCNAVIRDFFECNYVHPGKC